MFVKECRGMDGSCGPLQTCDVKCVETGCSIIIMYRKVNPRFCLVGAAAFATRRFERWLRSARKSVLVGRPKSRRAGIGRDVGVESCHKEDRPR